MLQGVIISVFAVIFIFLAAVSHALMPNYARQAPISTNQSAPTAVALDSAGNLYVLESVYGKLHIYNSSGVYVETHTGLDEPASVAVDTAGNIFIGSKGTGSVDKYDSNMVFLSKLGAGDGEFTHPNAIAIDSNTGYIYVSDGAEDVIKVFFSAGGLNFSFGNTGGGNGQFNFPNGIAIDALTNTLIISDLKILVSGQEEYETARVQLFDMSGNFSSTFGAFGVGEGYLFRPAGVAVDSLSRIYVSDAFQNVTQVFDSTGIYEGTIFDIDNPMRTPVGIALTPSNTMYVASLNAARVDVYNITEPPAGAQITVNPASYDFGSISAGYSSLPQIFTISNTGLGDLVIGTFSITGTDFTEFGIQTDNCSSQTLLYLEECTVSVDFSPASGGGKSADLSMPSNDPVTPTATAGLSGTGVTGNTPPTSVPGGPYTGTEGQSVAFDGSGSSDSDGTVDLYEWDIDNDGTYDYSSTLPTRNHTYATDGIYTVKLRVTDNFGATNEATTTADIADTAPTANFNGTPLTGSSPLTVTFTNTSTGYDQPLTYEWDFDNNGTVDSTVTNPQYIYNNAGLYTVKLTATDSDLSTNSLTRTDYIQVTAGGCGFPPVAIGGTFYYSMQTAYDEATEGTNIKSQDEIIVGDLNVNRPISVTLTGGYDCNYSSITGETQIQGTGSISDGTVTISNGVIHFVQ